MKYKTTKLYYSDDSISSVVHIQSKISAIAHVRGGYYVFLQEEIQSPDPEIELLKKQLEEKDREIALLESKIEELNEDVNNVNNY